MYYAAELYLPALAGRGDDIALIARTKLGDFARAEGRRITGFSEAALDILMANDWPGNVRELLNMLWLLVLTQDGPVVTPASLPDDITSRPVEDAPPPAPDLGGTSLVGKTLAEIERLVIEATIRAEGGSLPRASRVLGVSRSTVQEDWRSARAWLGVHLRGGTTAS